MAQSLRVTGLKTIDHKHPGQTGLMALAHLVWWPHIHSDIMAKAQACHHCIDNGQNPKAIIPKSRLSTLSKLLEPNEELQMDFTGPNPYKNNIQQNYIFVTLDRLSRYPHAETFNTSDDQTAIGYLEKFCGVHGIPESLVCGQAQAFQFEIFCKNRII